MSAREIYRIHAADCLRLARATRDPYTRSALVSMAQAWVRLAEQATSESDGPGPQPDLRRAA